MLKQFKTFLTTSNALALGVGVIIGAATGKIVSAIVNDLLMPIISLFIPAGDWRSAELVLKRSMDAAGKEVVTAIKYGDLFGSILDFLIISWVVFLIVKMLVPARPEPAAAATRTCPECLETIPALAHRCKHCTATLV
jgi:large conductance mechanosensitive channel